MSLMISRRTGLSYFIIAGLVFAVGLGYALHISPTYTVDSLLIPKEPSNAPQLSGGLASASRLLGISPVNTDSDFSKFQKYWASRDVAQRLIDKNPSLLPTLFRSNWDEAHHVWYNYPRTLRQIVAVPLNKLFGVYPNFVPTAQDLAAYIKAAMVVDTDQLGTQIHITYSAPDAHFAQWFLGTVIAETDTAVREAEQRRDNDFVSFARSRLGRETNIGYRDALTNSLLQFEISSMYSEAGDNFCFQYVEPPDLPLNHTAPKPLTDTLLAFLFANLVAASVMGTTILWPTSRFARMVEGLSNWTLHLFGRSPFEGGVPGDHGKTDRRAG